MNAVFKFTCMLSCTLILIQLRSKANLQLPNVVWKTTREGQLQDQPQKIGFNLVTFIQNIIS